MATNPMIGGPLCGSFSGCAPAHAVIRFPYFVFEKGDETYAIPDADGDWAAMYEWKPKELAWRFVRIAKRGKTRRLKE